MYEPSKEELQKELLNRMIHTNDDWHKGFINNKYFDLLDDINRSYYLIIKRFCNKNESSIAYLNNRERCSLLFEEIYKYIISKGDEKRLKEILSFYYLRNYSLDNLNECSRNLKKCVIRESLDYLDFRISICPNCIDPTKEKDLEEQIDYYKELITQKDREKILLNNKLDKLQEDYDKLDEQYKYLEDRFYNFIISKRLSKY